MAWVWEWPQSDWGADFDGSIYTGIEPYSDVAVLEKDFAAIFRTRRSIAGFLKLHCPPMGHYPVVDELWKDIILKFVPSDRVQFFPTTLIGRGGESTDAFHLVIPFDRVHCIDERRSRFTSTVKTPQGRLYFGPERIFHRDGCMGNIHLARDTIVTTHLLVSDALKSALSETGESSMFYRPEELPLTRSR